MGWFVVHNVLLAGPPGAGKTLQARAMPGILPALSIDEALEVTKIYSVSDLLLPETPLIQLRPFRAPHHTISNTDLVGGGRWSRPGEVSLAHRGVLFLDELPEYGKVIGDQVLAPGWTESGFDDAHWTAGLGRPAKQ
jgi:magnesium chelatase family protein